ncbi:mCG1048780, partial [Mus musculus]
VCISSCLQAPVLVSFSNGLCAVWGEAVSPNKPLPPHVDWVMTFYQSERNPDQDTRSIVKLNSLRKSHDRFTLHSTEGDGCGPIMSA